MSARTGRFGAVHLGRATEAPEVPGPLSATSEPPCPYCGAVEGEAHERGCRRGPDAPALAADADPSPRLRGPRLVSAAYEAWGLQDRQPTLLGVAADKAGCDRIHRRHEVGGITVRGGIVVAVFPGTGKGAVAELRRAAEAAHRERGDLPAPAEVERERLRLVAPAPEEPAGDEDDEESGSTNDPDDADCDDEEEVTTAPADGAQEHEPMESESAIKSTTGDETENTTRATCGAHGCTRPAGRVLSVTRPEVVGFCTECRILARRLQFNRGMEPAAAAQELRERGYVPIAPAPPTKVAPVRSKADTRCPVPGCGAPPASVLPSTTEEFRDLCRAHRTRARDLVFKLPEYTPALARERVVTGQRPAALGAAPTAAERGKRGGAARSKVLRPAKAETVRSVPAVAPAPVLVSLAPAGSPLGERVAVVRRLVACEARAGGVEVVEQLVELAARCGGAGELAALVAAVLG